MTASFRFTDVGEGLDEGEIVAWLVNVGDTVTAYQPLVSVETDKSVVDLPSPFAGRVVALHGEPGDVVKVGSLLVEIAEMAPDPTAEPPVTMRAKASPATRKLAVELDIDLTHVSPTGEGHRITMDDVRAAAANNGRDALTQPAAQNRAGSLVEPALGVNSIGLHECGGEVAPAAVEPGLRAGTPRPGRVRPETGSATDFGTKPLRGLRKRISEVMTQSWSTIPHVQAMDEIDATRLLAGRDRLRQQLSTDGPRLTVLSFAVKAAAVALRRYPMMNASIDPSAGTFTLHAPVNIGLAVATDDGLVVPVLADADRRSLHSIASEIDRLSAAARSRTLTPAESHGGTFTITNYGSFGGTWGSPIIRPPEAGILGLGGIKARPFVVDGAVMARQTLPLVACADHRLVDGDVLGGFLMLVGELLSDPVRMLLED